jgi:hypothetical protein
MHTGWIIGVARKAGGRIDAEDYAVAIVDMTMALNAVRRRVGRAPDVHVWVREPLLEAAPNLAPGGIRRWDAPHDGSRGLRRAG